MDTRINAMEANNINGAMTGAIIPFITKGKARYKPGE